MNYFLAWYKFETYIGMLFDKWSWSMILSIWLRDFFQKCIQVNKFCTVFFPNFLRPKVNFMAFLNIDISSKKLQRL